MNVHELSGSSLVQFISCQVGWTVRDLLHLFDVQCLRAHRTHTLCFQQPAHTNSSPHISNTTQSWQYGFCFLVERLDEKIFRRQSSFIHLQWTNFIFSIEFRQVQKLLNILNLLGTTRCLPVIKSLHQNLKHL